MSNENDFDITNIPQLLQMVPAMKNMTEMMMNNPQEAMRRFSQMDDDGIPPPMFHDTDSLYQTFRLENYKNPAQRELSQQAAYQQPTPSAVPQMEMPQARNIGQVLAGGKK